MLDLWVWGPDRGPRRIQRFVGSDTERLRSPRLSASSTAVGLELFVTHAGPRGGDRIVRSRSYLGAFGQPLRLVSSCANANPAARSIDLQESAAVFRGPECQQVTVRPLAHDAITTRRLPDEAFAMRLAGPFEAWLEGPIGGGDCIAAVVREGSTGREVTRVSAGVLPDGIVDHALRVDGTSALLYQRMRDTRSRTVQATKVALVDPGAIRARTLPLTLLAPEGARWIGAALGVVAAERSEPQIGVLQIVDTEGRTMQRIVKLGRDRELMRHTDLTAQGAVWVTRGCASAHIRTISLPTPNTVKQRTPTCTLRLVGRAKVQDDRLRFGISCAGFSIGCAALVTVRAGRHVIASGTARYNHSTPPYGAADLKVSPAGMQMLRTNPRTRLQISARIGESELIDNPSMHGTLTRRTTQTIAVARR